MKSTVSFNVIKYKKENVGIYKHNERTENDGRNHDNKNIDPKKTHENIFLIDPQKKTLLERIETRLDAGYQAVYDKDVFSKNGRCLHHKGDKKAIRKDAVLFCGITVQLGHDAIERENNDDPDSPYKHFTKEQQIQALKNAYKELGEMYGKENIVSAVIHMDETNPHLHCYLVPLKNGKLSAKTLFHDKESMRKTQQDFLKRMQSTNPEFGFVRQNALEKAFNGLKQDTFMAVAKNKKEMNEEKARLRNEQNEINKQQIKLIEQGIEFNINNNQIKQRLKQEQEKIAKERAENEKEKKEIAEEQQKLNQQLIQSRAIFQTLTSAQDSFNQREQLLRQEQERIAKEKAENEKTKAEIAQAKKAIADEKKQFETEKSLFVSEKADFRHEIKKRYDDIEKAKNGLEELTMRIRGYVDNALKQINDFMTFVDSVKSIVVKKRIIKNNDDNIKQTTMTVRKDLADLVANIDLDQLIKKPQETTQQLNQQTEKATEKHVKFCLDGISFDDNRQQHL